MVDDRSFVETNRKARERLQAVVTRLSDGELQRELSDGWTVAAALAHVALWDRRALVLVKKWQRTGEAPSPSPVDVHVINDAVQYLSRLIPPRDAANEAVAAADAVDAELEGLSSEILAGVLAAESPRVERASHRHEHLDEIERALKGG